MTDPYGELKSDLLALYMGNGMLANARRALEDAWQQASQDIEGVDAVYINDIGQVTFVVAEHDAEVYERILDIEDKALEAFEKRGIFPPPNTIRAHQGRHPSAAVPPGLKCLFMRQKEEP